MGTCQSRLERLNSIQSCFGPIVSALGGAEHRPPAAGIVLQAHGPPTMWHAIWTMCRPSGLEAAVWVCDAGG